MSYNYLYSNNEPEFDFDHTCQSCTDKNNIIDIAQDYLCDVIKMIYSEGALDVAKLDDALGELCVQLNVKHPTQMPNIRRPDLLTSWIESNNKYLKELA